MKFLSVCSGIEAASVAWNPLGWSAVAFSEIEPFPCSVLTHHYPYTPNLGDMTNYESWSLENFDLLCGGTPCQSFSVAGLRKGLDDPRGNLMLTFGAIAAKHRPRWLVWENVPGVLSSNGGRDFGSFLGMLAQVGYGFAYRVLDAQFFGVAQRRRRVFVVGCLGDWRSAAAVLFERHSLSGHPAPSREAGERVAPCVTSGSANGGAAHGARSGSAKEGLIVPHGIPERARALTTSCQRIDAETETLLPVAHSLRGEGFDASEDGTGRGTPLVPVPFDTTQMTSAANRSNPKPGDPCHPLAAGAHAPAVAWSIMPQNSGRDYKARQVEVLQPLMAGAGQYGNQGGDVIQQAMQVRRLTPRECERLQGFPDDYTAVPHRGKPAADGPRYKALGNSWAVPCAVWIGRRIEAVEALTDEVFGGFA